MVSSPDQIMAELVEFYSNLYQSQQQFFTESLQKFLNGIKLPCLSEAQWRFLDAPITLKQLQMAAGLFPNSKASGVDE